ncbi:MAG TPA: sensor histidine kinase [Streptosporangiaceae bacterium]|nr:sensor histidine kinase [Streptosporangiaceae bacterium]
MKRLASWATGLPPRMQDLALAVALAIYNAGSLIPETRQLQLPYVAFMLVILQALPLAWRRRWPVAVFFAVGIPRTIYDQLNLNFAPIPLGPAIAYYTIMDRSSTRVRVVINVLLVYGIVRSQMLPGHNEPYDFFVDVLQFAVAGTLGILSRTRRAYVQEVEARAEHAEAERAGQVALAAATERARIARELHDVVAHHVSLMAVQSEAAAALLPGRPEEASKSVEIIGRTAREALTELRRLLGVLRGPADVDGRATTAPSPSVSQLDDVLGQVRQAGIAVDLRVEGSPSKLPPGVDLAAYRIVQEALTNTVRHSGAYEAAVTVSYEPGYVTVSVTDSGNGAIAISVDGKASPARSQVAARDGGRPHLADSGGFGLAGIAERVASCGGKLTVGPGDAGGFAVTARLPMP